MTDRRVDYVALADFLNRCLADGSCANCHIYLELSGPSVFNKSCEGCYLKKKGKA